MSKKLILALTTATLAISGNAYAKKDSKEMERVMVIGSDNNLNKIAGSAHYIGLEDLKQHNYNDVNRILRQVPGVNLQEEEGYGNRPNIGIRGGRSERSADISLMEDGVLIAPAPYAAPSAYYFPRVNRMEAIEVRKGSSSIKFGPRTTSGAVNMISSSIPAKKSEGRALLGYGINNTQRAELNQGGTYGNFGYVIDVGHEKTDGFKDIDIVGGDSGFSIQDIMAKFRISSNPNAKIYQHVDFKIGATSEESDETYLGLTQADFDQDPFRRYAASQHDNMDANHEQYQIRHYIEPAKNWDVTTTLYRNNFSRNWYKLQSATVGGTKKSLSSALDDASYLSALKGETNLAGDSSNNLKIRANNRDYYSQGIQSNIGHQFALGNTKHDLEFGARYHYDEEDRFQQEDTYSITNGVMNVTSYGAPGSNANRVGKARATALFLEDEINIGKLNIIPGVRYENIRLSRNNRSNGDIHENDLDVFLPALGISYNVNENLNIFSSIHEGFAPPSPSSNVSQDAEESINYEAGLRYNKNDLRTEFTAFFTDYSNLLGEETLSSGSGSGTGDQFNGGEVNVYGLEAGIAYDLSNFLKTSKFNYPVSLNYTFTKAQFRNDFTSNFDEWGTVTTGDELPYIPTHQIYASFGIKADKWLVNIAAKFIDEMRTSAGKGKIGYSSGTDKHLVADITGEYEIFKQARLFTSIYNITNEKYVAARRPAGARPGAPLTFLTGIKVKF